MFIDSYIVRISSLLRETGLYLYVIKELLCRNAISDINIYLLVVSQLTSLFAGD
jgi:hypothetical protein